jgi:hypothetical protein
MDTYETSATVEDQGQVHVFGRVADADDCAYYFTITRRRGR